MNHRTFSTLLAWSLGAAFLVAVPVTTSAFAPAEDKNASKDGWQVLLNDDLSANWKTTGNWKLEKGVATLTPRPGESGWTRYGAYLWSKKKYDDFEIEFDYKVEKAGNSGFYFNVSDEKDPVAKGIEVQIFDAHSGDDAKLTDHDSGGVIPGVAPTKATAKPAGEWNTFRIRVEGDALTVSLNGEKVNEVDLSKNPQLKDRPKSGLIGFQDHGLPLSLRNIRVREL
jgi:hypothetical protein